MDSDDKIKKLKTQVQALRWIIALLIVLWLLGVLIGVRNFTVLNGEIESNWCNSLEGYTIVENSTYKCVMGEW